MERRHQNGRWPLNLLHPVYDVVGFVKRHV
jgi:hypothetical protein